MLCNLGKNGGAYEVVIGFRLKADRSSKIFMLDFHDRNECVAKFSGSNSFHRGPLLRNPRLPHAEYRCIRDTQRRRSGIGSKVPADVITCMPATYERADYAMMKHKLKVALQTLGHTRALKDGTVRLPDFEFEFEEVPAIIQAFRRMVRGLEFDVCEMALPTYLAARAYHKRFTALPIFLVRGFHHGAILYNTKLGIGGPKDLEGRKVGANR